MESDRCAVHDSKLGSYDLLSESLLTSKRISRNPQTFRLYSSVVSGAGWRKGCQSTDLWDTQTSTNLSGQDIRDFGMLRNRLNITERAIVVSTEPGLGPQHLRTGGSFNHRLFHDLNQPPRLRGFGRFATFLDRAATPPFA